MHLAALGSRDPLRSETSCETHASLDPALKDFLDRVIIPALVREFTKTLLASSEGAEAQSLQHARREESVRELRCAIYARFSSDRQSPTSISDQISTWREYAARQPGRLVLDQ